MNEQIKKALEEELAARMQELQEKTELREAQEIAHLKGLAVLIAERRALADALLEEVSDGDGFAPVAAVELAKHITNEGE